MLKTNNYFIRIQNSSSTIKGESDFITHSFQEAKSTRTIKFESQIANFMDFEDQLMSLLKKVNYIVLPWNKNTLYFSVPNDIDSTQIRCYFDSADHCDAKSTFLLRENVAILLNPEFQESSNIKRVIIGLFKTKVEISIMNGLDFSDIKTYYA